MLGHFNQEQVFIFIGGYFFVDAVQMTLFSSNMWMLPTLVNRGDLDYYLLRPVSALFFVTLREFAANSFINLFFAIGILIWGFQQYQGTLEPFAIVLFFVALIMSCGLFYMMNLLFLLPIFWTHSPKGLGDLFWSMTRVMERPDSIYAGWFRRVTTTILPLAIVASYPARILFDDNRYEVLALHTLIIFLFAVVVRLVWGYALKNYSSASS